MSQKLQELTEKLYQEGVEKARTEAKIILDDAEKQKKAILDAATKEAETLIKNGKKDAEALISKGKSELSMASKQAVSSLKQSITGLLSHQILNEGITEALNEKSFLKSVIQELVSKWASDGDSMNFNLILSEAKEKEFGSYLKKELKTLLDQGLVVDFKDRMQAGFRIESQDGSFILSFTDQDFEQFFQSFVKEKTRALLFAGN